MELLNIFLNLKTFRCRTLPHLSYYLSYLPASVIKIESIRVYKLTKFLLVTAFGNVNNKMLDVTEQ